MTIPEVRKHLIEIAVLFNNLAEQQRQMAAQMESLAFMITRLEAELYRRKPVRKAAPRRKTPPKATILSLVASNPDLDQCAIAQALGTNPARVSEAVAGKRT